MKRVLLGLRNPYLLLGIGLMAFALGLTLYGPQGLFVGLLLAWSVALLRLVYTLRQEQRQLYALLTLLAAKGGSSEETAD